MDGLKTLNILFLEDNEEFAKNTKEFLGIYFKTVYHASTIKEALEFFNDKKIDVIISDIKIKDDNGLIFVQSVRKISSDIPIIILSAHKDEEFLFKAIPLNIFSYELKPLTYKNFIGLLNKLSKKFSTTNIVSLKNGLKYNFGDKLLYLENTHIKLTKREMLLIELMIKNIAEVVTNDMIQRNVWEDKFMSDSAIKNLVFRLRKKVGFSFIQTVQSIGYKLEN